MYVKLTQIMSISSKSVVNILFSLQNTMWVDPLVEKEVLLGMQTKTYSLDVGRDLIQMGYAEKNVKV